MGGKSKKRVTKDYRPLALFGIEGQKGGTLLENRVHQESKVSKYVNKKQRNYNSSIFDLQTRVSKGRDCFRTSFSCFRTSFSALSCFVPRPVPDFGCPGPSRPFARFLACPVVPLSRDNDGISVPLSRKVSLSRPVGNASIHNKQA